jgi:hypothetical protein
MGWVGLRSERISHRACGQNLLCSEEKLRCYYENLRPTSIQSVAARYFPLITAYRDGGKKRELRISRFFGR